MATIAEIRAGLAANLSAAYGANLEVSPYVLGQTTPPSMQVVPGEINYDQAMRRGLDILEFFIEIVVGSAMDQGAQVKLDTYLAPTGSSSVKTAIESDPTLGGKVGGVRATGVSDYGKSASEAGELLGCRVRVEVYANN